MESQKIDNFIYKAWSIQKGGNLPSQNEDAYSISQLDRKIVIALSDGSTEGIYSSLWAKTLVNSVKNEDITLFDDDKLKKFLDQIRNNFSPLNSNLWYIKNKFLVQGSQATLLVVVLEMGSEDLNCYSIKTLSVGDSCFFKLSKDKIESFPIIYSKDFGVSPSLVKNKYQPNLIFNRYIEKLNRDEILILGTDAISQWILANIEQGKLQDVIESLKKIYTEEKEFERWIEEVREDKEIKMKNDDVTLIIGSLGNPDELIESLLKSDNFKESFLE